MGRVKAYAMDMEEKFWDIADKEIGGYEVYGEFEEMMLDLPEVKGCLAFNTLDDVKDTLEDGWSEFWSKNSDLEPTRGPRTYVEFSHEGIVTRMPVMMKKI